MMEKKTIEINAAALPAHVMDAICRILLSDINRSREKGS